MADLEVVDLAKEYPTRAEPVVVLRGISLEMNAGDNAAILGASGCGKSTLLHILGTIDNPTSGRVEIEGRNPFDLAEPQLADFRNQKIGFVFQDHHLLPQCSVLENVLVPSIAAGTADRAAIDRAASLIKRVGLSSRIEHRPAELSGGERQRAAVARALINRPALLLADEPTGNLDRDTARSVSELLLELQAEERMIMIVVTHSAELAAMLKRRWQLNGGKLEPI